MATQPLSPAENLEEVFEGWLPVERLILDLTKALPVSIRLQWG
jgi:hypothetical protein